MLLVIRIVHIDSVILEGHTFSLQNCLIRSFCDASHESEGTGLKQMCHGMVLANTIDDLGFEKGVT